MFAIYSLMGIPFKRFEVEADPIWETRPAVEGDGPESTSPDEPTRSFELISTEERNPHEELASLGLVKKTRDRDDLAFFSLSFLSPRRGK
jgi:hypothetical protein